MLKHYVTFYPNTDKLKTFKQTWEGKDEICEEYYENGNISLKKQYDGNEWVVRGYDENGSIIYFEESNGFIFRV